MLTPDMIFPSTMFDGKKQGRKLLMRLAYDIMAACSGFLYSVSTASKFIETGSYKKIIVVGTDKMSSIVDYSDRTTCIIFGDGAGGGTYGPLYRRIWSSRLHIKK